jgi:hypothetical protein
MKNQLTSQMHDDDLHAFLIQKDSWSTQTLDSIKWNASERALRRLSKNRQMDVVKLCHNYWHTGSRHVKFYEGDRPCCLFQETKEDWRHILNCQLLDASYHRDTEMPHGKKSKRTCKCGASRQTSGQQWKRDFSTYHETYKNQQAHHYLSKHLLTQS